MRVDLEETELDELTRRANCEKACVQHVLGTEGKGEADTGRGYGHTYIV